MFKAPREAGHQSGPYWGAACASIRGTSHIRSGHPCQDASALAHLGASREIVVMALSDGAGAAQYAHLGAEIVVRNWMNFFTTLFAEHPEPVELLRSFDRQDAYALLARMRADAYTEAETYDTGVREFSATLLGAVLTPSHALVMQVGDGAWVAQKQGVLGCLTWPVGGEFAGETTFVISDSAESFLQMVHLPGAPEALAGFSDGVERLVLDFEKKVPVAGFFSPTFRALQSGAAEFQGQLEEFLQSGRVCERSDDDKSICLALKMDADFG